MYIKVWTMKLPDFPIWGKVHLAISGKPTLCGIIERDKSLRVESGDYVRNLKQYLREKSSCKTCSRIAKLI